VWLQYYAESEVQGFPHEAMAGGLILTEDAKYIPAKNIKGALCDCLQLPVILVRSNCKH
jgi:hypothetical protein